MGDTNWSNPDWDLAVNSHNQPIRQEVSRFTTQELIDELCKREGVDTYAVREYQRYSVVIGDARWVGEGQARVVVIKN